MDLLKNYRVGDRVNSVRGLGVNPSDPDRETRHATTASPEELRRFALNERGELLIPARILEVHPGGLLKLGYDGGGEGWERRENTARRFGGNYVE